MQCVGLGAVGRAAEGNERLSKGGRCRRGGAHDGAFVRTAVDAPSTEWLAVSNVSKRTHCRRNVRTSGGEARRGASRCTWCSAGGAERAAVQSPRRAEAPDDALTVARVATNACCGAPLLACED